PSESKCVLKLRRRSIEAGFEPVVVQRSVPAAIQHQKQIVAGLQDPPKPALQTGDSRLIVVLGQVGPGNVRREVVVGAQGQYLCIKRALWQRHVVSLDAAGQRDVRVRLERQSELRLPSVPRIEAT